MTQNIDFDSILDNEDVDDIFTLEEEIASGSFGTVYKGTHLPTGKTMAIKIITPDEDEIPEDLMIEIAVFKKCDNENIVKFYGGYKKGDEIFIAMELCAGSARDIFDYSDDPLQEDEIALIMHESLKGLKYMHDCNMIHRDIKAGNILVTEDGKVKLVDFGVTSLNAKNAKTFVGTPFWMSPELIESKNGSSTYGKKVDIWALGITCIELAETVPPLSFVNPMRALFQIPARDSPQLEHKEKWSDNFHNFIATCLEKNPKKRPTAEQLLQHPFVRDCNKDPAIISGLVQRKQKYEELCEYEDYEEYGDNEDNEYNEEYGDNESNEYTEPYNENQEDSEILNTNQQNNNNFLIPLQKAESEDPIRITANVPPKVPYNEAINNLSQSQQLPKLNKSEQKPSSQINIAKPTERSTLKRPVGTTRRTTKKANDGVNRVINRRVIKQQMKELRTVQTRLQKRINKQQKIHQKEKDQIYDNYKKLHDQFVKNNEVLKKNMEKSHKQEQEGLIKSQVKNQKLLQKNYENETKNMIKQNKENSKNSLKTHTINQKNLKQEQKSYKTQSKKKLTKQEMKALDKDHKVHIQLNSLMYNHQLARETLLKELKLIWNNRLKIDKQKSEELLQTQQQERELFKQYNDFILNEVEQKYNFKVEELQKIQPLEIKQLNERCELEKKNLDQQLQIEKQQQMQLLISDQKKQTKGIGLKKKQFQKQSLEQQKLLRSSIKAKPELKNKIQLEKENLQRRIKNLEEEHKREMVNQKEMEAKRLEEFQNKQRQQLIDKFKEDSEKLVQYHSQQRSELHQEEMRTRNAILDDHHCSELELMNKQFKEQTTLLDSQHGDKFLLLAQHQKQITELIENHKKECLTLISSNSDKLPPTSNNKFNEMINNEYSNVSDHIQKIHQEDQHELSKLLEEEQSKLKEAKTQLCEITLRRQRSESQNLEKLDKAYASVLIQST